MDFCPREIRRWEQELHEKNTKRMYKTGKSYRCPRRERMLNYRRNNGGGHFYSKEDTGLRVDYNRRFRRWLKLRVEDETYYRPVPHDYKTYGWMTW